MKPIFIVRIKKDVSETGEQFRKRFNEVCGNLGPQLINSYYPIFLTVSEENTTLEDITFEAFYPQDFGKIHLDELQKIINENVTLYALREKVFEVSSNKKINPIDLSNYSKLLTNFFDEDSLMKIRKNITEGLGVPAHLQDKQK